MGGLVRFVGALLLCVAAFGAQAQSASAWPTRPVRVIVPYAVGGATDIMARTVSQKLGEILGQPVLIENRTGANTAIGADLVARAPADGYTLMFTNDATFVINPILFGSLSYNMARDFVPVATVAYLNLALMVAADHPARTFNDFVAWAKARSGTLSYGSYGVGSQAHLMGEAFKKSTGTDIVHVPYKGAAPAMADVVGGQVAFTFPSIATMQAFLKSGKVRALAISGDRRSALLPEVPTFSELGYKDIDIGAWYGFFAPAGTPREVVARLNAAVATLLSNREFVEQGLIAQGMVPMNLSPEQMAAHMRSETERMTRIVRISGAKVE